MNDEDVISGKEQAGRKFTSKFSLSTLLIVMLVAAVTVAPFMAVLYRSWAGIGPPHFHLKIATLGLVTLAAIFFMLGWLWGLATLIESKRQRRR